MPRHRNASKEVIERSQPHRAPGEGGSSFGDVLKGAASSAGKFLLDKGWETLLSIGTSLLANPLLLAQVGDATTVPRGTILGSVNIYPNFAENTQLQRKASTFLRYKFQDSWVTYTPAPGALANGQIGFFITSDPRYQLTATGDDAIRLVREFKGEICQISQPGRLKVPAKGDWLYVEDAHDSDTRFTQQGTLWVIAFTDLALDLQIGEFALDYNVALKDNALEGAEISPVGVQPSAVFSFDHSLTDNDWAMQTSSHTPVFVSQTQNADTAWPGKCKALTSAGQEFVTQLIQGYTVKPGSYEIEYDLCLFGQADRSYPYDTVMIFSMELWDGGSWARVGYEKAIPVRAITAPVQSLTGYYVVASGTIGITFAAEQQIRFTLLGTGETVNSGQTRTCTLIFTQLVAGTASTYVNRLRGIKVANGFSKTRCPKHDKQSGTPVSTTKG